MLTMAHGHPEMISEKPWPEAEGSEVMSLMTCMLPTCTPHREGYPVRNCLIACSHALTVLVTTENEAADDEEHYSCRVIR